MTKTIFKKISLTKEHESALEKATSEKYLKKIVTLEKERKSRFNSIRNKPSTRLSSAMAKI